MPTLSIHVDVNQVVDLINQLNLNSKRQIFDRLKMETLVKPAKRRLRRKPLRLKLLNFSNWPPNSTFRREEIYAA